MAGFDDHLAGLDEAVSAALGDAAVLRPAAGGPEVPCRVIVERPTEEATLEDGRMVRGRPTLEVSAADVPRLRKDDHVVAGGTLFKIAAAPSRPGDGRWWLADVLDMGPAA